MMFARAYEYILNNPYHLIFLMMPAILILIWCITLLTCRRRGKIYNEKGMENDVIFQNALRRLNVWLTAATFWMIVEYLCVILPFVANAIVVYLAIEADKAAEITVYSIISLAFVVFGYAINPQRHKQCYRKAYAQLDSAVNTYLVQFADGNVEKSYIEKITEALEHGEKEINASYDV